MDLYLMQHGQATTETEDPERPLTGGLVKLEPKVDRDGFSVAWALPPDLA